MVTHKTLAEALVAAQADMPAVEPDAVNPHFKSKFTSLDHLIAKTRPVLTRHGLAITQWPTHLDGQPALRTKVTHVSGESDEDVMPLLLGKQDMQGLGGAVTYAKRYMWGAVCAVSTDEDDDGTAASAPGKPAAETPTVAKTDDTAALRMKFEALLLAWEHHTPDFDRLAAVAAAEKKAGQAGYAAWLERQIATLEKNIAAKQADANAQENFPIPDKAKEAA